MMRKVLGAAVGLALLAPAAARADMVCATGSISLYACASISVSFVDAGNGTGSIVVQVANLDAWNNNTFNGNAVDGYRLTGFGIVADPTLIGVVTGFGGANFANASATSGNFNTWTGVINSHFSSIEVEAGAATSSGVNGGIVGCLPDGASANYSATCGAGTYIAFTFTTNQTLQSLQTTYANAQFSYGLRGQSGGVDNDESYRCLDNDANDPDCLVDDPPTNVSEVPEPITMILLGTGLAGVGAARRRRRNGDVSDA